MYFNVASWPPYFYKLDIHCMWTHVATISQYKMQTVKLMKTAYIVGKMHTEVKTKGEYVVIFTYIV